MRANSSRFTVSVTDREAITAILSSAHKTPGRTTQSSGRLSKKSRTSSTFPGYAQNNNATDAEHPCGTRAEFSWAKLYSARITNGDRGRKASPTTHKCIPENGPLGSKNSYRPTANSFVVRGATPCKNKPHSLPSPVSFPTR